MIHRSRHRLPMLLIAAGCGLACSMAGISRAPSSLRDYEYLIVGTDTLDEALAKALRDAHLTVRRKIRGGETPTLVVMHYHESAPPPGPGEPQGAGYLLLQLTDTRRVGVVGEARLDLDSIGPGAGPRARALLDSLGLKAH